MEFLYSSIDDNSPWCLNRGFVESGYFSHEWVHSIYGKIDTSYDRIYELWEIGWLLDTLCLWKRVFKWNSCPLIRGLPSFIKINCHSHWDYSWCPECKVRITPLKCYRRHVEMVSVEEEWETEFANIITSSSKFATPFEQKCEHDSYQHQVSWSRHDE